MLPSSWSSHDAKQCHHGKCMSCMYFLRFSFNFDYVGDEVLGSASSATCLLCAYIDGRSHGRLHGMYVALAVREVSLVTLVIWSGVVIV